MFERFFVWLILLELIKLGVTTRIRMDQPTKLKLFSVLIVLLLPTIYIIISNYFGLNTAVFEWSKQQGVYWHKGIATSIEYLAFAGFFTITICLSQV